MRLEAALAERRRKAEEEAKEAERLKTEQKRNQVCPLKILKYMHAAVKWRAPHKCAGF